jgi:hypothetical protein
VVTVLVVGLLTLRSSLVTLDTTRFYKKKFYKACPSESVTEVGVPLFPAVELYDFLGRWQCMSGEI